MTVLEKLEKRINELDRTVKRSLASGYSFSEADQRELLEEAAARIRALEQVNMLASLQLAGKPLPHGFTPSPRGAGYGTIN